MAHDPIYDQSVGYSSLNMVDSAKKFAEVANCKQVIVTHLPNDLAGRLLVAGTGNGEEARIVSMIFMLPTFGVDVDRNLAYQTGICRNLYLCRQDITNMGFSEKTFSIIYSYHVLEHIQDPIQALNEFRRLLVSGGILFIGFPNKNRLFSYFGTSQKASFLDKVFWNLNDYKNRLTNKFENRYGSHAGFTEKEFLNFTSNLFTSTIPVRNDYMLRKYKKYQGIIKFIIRSGFAELLFPSNYFICIK
jgi:SAM-dependent methyltransferase